MPRTDSRPSSTPSTRDRLGPLGRSRAPTVARVASSSEPRAADPDRQARLGYAVLALSRELSYSRREVAALERENAALRALVTELEQAARTNR